MISEDQKESRFLTKVINLRVFRKKKEAVYKPHCTAESETVIPTTDNVIQRLVVYPFLTAFNKSSIASISFSTGYNYGIFKADSSSPSATSWWYYGKLYHEE